MRPGGSRLFSAVPESAGRESRSVGPIDIPRPSDTIQGCDSLCPPKLGVDALHG